MAKPTPSPCEAQEKVVKDATRVRFACDERLRAVVAQAEGEVEAATLDWKKAQAVLDKARASLEACRKKNNLSVR